MGNKKMDLKKILFDIDDKGRILVHRRQGREWRMNIIDLLVLVLAVSLLPTIWFGYKVVKYPKGMMISINMADYAAEQIQHKEEVSTLRTGYEKRIAVLRAGYEKQVAEYKKTIARHEEIKRAILQEHKRLERYF